MRSVHRMLVEDHDILHRDISWTNALIDAIHLEGDTHDDFCGRPFIDAILGVGYASQMPKDNRIRLKFNAGKKQRKCMLHYQTLNVRASLEVISYVNYTLLEARLRYATDRLPGVGLRVNRERPCSSRGPCVWNHLSSTV